MNSNSYLPDSQATEQCSQDRGDVHCRSWVWQTYHTGCHWSREGAGWEGIYVAQAHPHQWLSFSSSYTGHFHKTPLRKLTNCKLSRLQTHNLNHPAVPDTVVLPGESGLLPPNCAPVGCEIYAQHSNSSKSHAAYPGRPPRSPAFSGRASSQLPAWANQPWPQTPWVAQSLAQT